MPFLLILIIIAGCSVASRHPRVLDEAQELMQRDPASALSKLNGLDISEFKDSATMARWALLYSEALAANKLAAPSDTIVNIAIDYYGRHNLTAELQKAQHLKATNYPADNGNPLATALYVQKEKEFLLYKERTRRGLYIFIGLVIILIAAGVILWMRQRLKVKSLQNDALMAEASGLKQQIDESSGTVNRLETKLHGLLENRFSLIDSLCQTYYETQGTKTERKAIIDKVKSEIESVRTDSFAEMEQAVNDCRDNLLLAVKEVYPDIKREDYQLYVFLAGRLSARTISLLLGESVEVIYKRKSRLKARLRERAPGSHPEIISVF